MIRVEGVCLCLPVQHWLKWRQGLLLAAKGWDGLLVELNIPESSELLADQGFPGNLLAC